MQTNTPPLRKHADYHLREWARERMRMEAKNRVIAAGAKLVIGLGIMAAISTLLFFVPFTGGGGRRSYSSSSGDIPSSLLTAALFLAIGVPLVGFIVQIFLHHRQYHVLKLESGTLRYTDHLSWTGDERGDKHIGHTVLGIVMIGPWLVISALESLLAALRLYTGNSDGVADVLGAMAVHGRKIPVLQLEHEYPGKDFHKVLREVHNLTGVHFYRRDETSIGLGDDLRLEIECVIHQ